MSSVDGKRAETFYFGDKDVGLLLRLTKKIVRSFNLTLFGSIEEETRFVRLGS